YIYLSLGGSDMDLARIKVSDCSPNGVTLYDLDNVGFPFPDGIVLSRDGRYLYLSQSGGDKIGVWEIINNTINYRRTVSTGDNPDRAIAITPDNQYLFIGCPGSSSDNVSRYTISGDNLIHSGSCGNVNDARYDLAVTPDNQYLIVLSSSDDKIYRYSLSYWNSCQRNEITQGVDSPRGVCIK
ncbi:MAG: beta-propeller fold lactonase family protein, partial [Patescibacteria group bacterium]